MVGNTYPYQLEDWKKGTSKLPAPASLTHHSDISLALSHGIDGFALNIGSDDWQEARVADAYNAARGTKFKLFISFDMAYLFHFRCTTMPSLTAFSIGSSHAGRVQMLDVSGRTLRATSYTLTK